MNATILGGYEREYILGFRSFRIETVNADGGEKIRRFIPRGKAKRIPTYSRAWQAMDRAAATGRFVEIILIGKTDDGQDLPLNGWWAADAKEAK